MLRALAFYASDRKRVERAAEFFRTLRSFRRDSRNFIGGFSSFQSSGLIGSNLTRTLTHLDELVAFVLLG
jgi:hypothetical protein